MAVIISIALVGLLMAAAMLLAAAMLSSQISSMESKITVDEGILNPQDRESPPDPFSS